MRVKPSKVEREEEREEAGEEAREEEAERVVVVEPGGEVVMFGTDEVDEGDGDWEGEAETLEGVVINCVPAWASCGL